MSGADLVNFNALQKKKRIFISAFYLTLTPDSGVHRPHALTSSESRFVLRMRMNAHLGSSPFLVPTEGIDGTW